MPEKPRTFAHFPPETRCPICGTNDDAECLLVGIDGTVRDRIQEAQPIHLWCAVGTNYRKDIGILYRRCKEV